MKFEPDRAIAWLETFDEPRDAGTEGEHRAAQVVAAELERIGLNVERVTILGSPWPALAEPCLGWIGLGVWAAGLELVTRYDDSWTARFVLALGAWLWLRLTVVEGFRLGRIWPRTVATTSVVARHDVEPAPALRVVFHTPLDTFDPGRSIVPTWLATPVIGLVLAAQVFIDLTIHSNPLRLPPWAGSTVPRPPLARDRRSGRAAGPEEGEPGRPR